MSESEFERLKEVKRKNRDHMIKLANVTGIGVGRKRVGAEVTETLSIRVYVVKKIPIEKLKKEDIIPSEIDGVPTDVIEVGKVRFIRYRPAKGGDSLSSCGYNVFGTLGGVFIDNTDGSDVILSCNHIIANCDTTTQNLANVGDNVVQPAEANGGDCDGADVIATLKRWVQFVLPPAWNYVDAAIAEVLNPADVSHAIRHIGVITGQRNLTTDDVGTTIVQKSGAATGLTYGKVADIAYDTLTTTWQGQTIYFQDQILIEPLDTQFGAWGDSGSLVLDNDRKVVGLLWSGTSLDWGIASHISNVCNELNIREPFFRVIPCPELLVIPCFKEISICVPLMIRCIKLEIEDRRVCYKQICEPMCINITPVPGRYAIIDLENIPKDMERQVHRMLDEIQKFRESERKK